ncbi:MAG: hypothetical protein ACYTHJ_16090 [Planctomycetota bacterium]
MLILLTAVPLPAALADVTPQACCVNGDCVITSDEIECLSLGGWVHPSGECGPDTQCPTSCEAPSCAGASIINKTNDEGDCDAGLPCSRPFNTLLCTGLPQNTDCELTPGFFGTTPLGGDTWLSYTTGPDETGWLTVSACSDGDYDAVIAVFAGTCESGDCQCPVDPGDPYACGDDTCGVVGGMATVTFAACPNTCYLFRVGGWSGQVGEGTLELSLTPDESACPCFVPATVLADDRFDFQGVVRSCATDDDCQAGEIGPEPQTVCRPDSQGGGVCYVARQRYLSLKPNPANGGLLIAYRVSVSGKSGDARVLGYVGPVSTLNVPGPGPTTFHLSRIVSTPEYRDWKTLSQGYLTVGSCAIVPGRDYLIQSIELGFDELAESSYSDPLLLPTVRDWCDCSAGGSPSGPPNGAAGTLVDVFAIVRRIQGQQDGPLDWFDVEPQQPDMLLTLADAFACVLAFQGEAYPFLAPEDCP